MQRARVALTHASGRYTPLVPSKNQMREDAAQFTNPYLAKSPSIQRLPPPRSSSTQSTTNPSSLSKSSPPTPRVSQTVSPFPSSYPTSQYNQARAALPTHLAISKSPAKPSEERFKLPDNHTLQRPIKKARIERFEPPKPKREMVDFFGEGPKGFMESLGRGDSGKKKR
jgi:hypothetical protein